MCSLCVFIQTGIIVAEGLELGVLGLGVLPGLRDHSCKLLFTQEIIIYRGARAWEFSQVLGPYLNV